VGEFSLVRSVSNEDSKESDVGIDVIYATLVYLGNGQGMIILQDFSI